MKAMVFENIFMVTMTCNNGNERRIKKSVYSPRFRNGKFLTEQERIKEGTEILKAECYYNIEYIKAVPTSLLYIG